MEEQVDGQKQIDKKQRQPIQACVNLASRTCVGLSDNARYGHIHIGLTVCVRISCQHRKQTSQKGLRRGEARRGEAVGQNKLDNYSATCNKDTPTAVAWSPYHSRAKNCPVPVPPLLFS